MTDLCDLDRISVLFQKGKLDTERKLVDNFKSSAFLSGVILSKMALERRKSESWILAETLNAASLRHPSYSVVTVISTLTLPSQSSRTLTVDLQQVQGESRLVLFPLHTTEEAFRGCPGAIEAARWPTTGAVTVRLNRQACIEENPICLVKRLPQALLTLTPWDITELLPAATLLRKRTNFHISNTASSWSCCVVLCCCRFHSTEELIDQILSRESQQQSTTSRDLKGAGNISQIAVSDVAEREGSAPGALEEVPMGQLPALLSPTFVEDDDEAVLRSFCARPGDGFTSGKCGGGDGGKGLVVSSSSSSESGRLSSVEPSTADAPAVEGDDGVSACTRMEVSLCCPISRQRIGIPVRGAACTHAAVFDLANYLNSCLRSCLWMCPICRTRLSIGELRVDAPVHLALRLLENVPLAQCDKILMAADGHSWSRVSRRRALCEVDADSDNDGEWAR